MTISYVKHTSKLSKTAHDQFKLQREQHLLENRPWVYITKFDRPPEYRLRSIFKFTLENCGKLPANLDDVKFNLYYNKELTDEDIQEVQKNVIFPGQKDYFVNFGCYQAIKKIKDNIDIYVVDIKFEYYSVSDFEKRKKCSFSGTFEIHGNLFNILKSHAE